MSDTVEKTLEAAEDIVDRVLGDHTAYYVIPNYQRPYSWTTAQVEQLWDDLQAWLLLNAGTPVEKMPPYFLGSIVLTRGASGWEVIDGQQRLTTLSILLAVARQAARDDALRAGLTRYLEGEQDMFSDAPPRLRLTARQRDADFWARSIIRQSGDFTALSEDGGLEDPQKNMVGNARWLAEKYAALDGSGQKRLLQALLKRCFLVVVRTRDTNTAMRIFQVLNDRGLDLRATDILKASILGDLPTPRQGQWTLFWEDAEANLGREGLETLFSHLRLIIRQKRQESTLIKEIEGEVKRLGAPTFLEDHLRLAVPAYRIVREREYEAASGAEVVNDHLTALGLLDNQDWEPIAIRLVQELRGDAPKLGQALARLETRAYWSLLKRDSVHARITSYLAVMTAATGGMTLSDALVLDPSQKAEALSLLDGQLYLEARARRPVLLLLNRLVSDDGVWMVPEKVTVEHVLPQNPREDSEWRKWYDLAAHERWVHRLGNLLLLSRRRNASASNWDFAVKKTKYFLTQGTSPFPLTSQVLALPDWTEDTLRRRHEDLKTRLALRWGLAS